MMGANPITDPLIVYNKYVKCINCKHHYLSSDNKIFKECNIGDNREVVISFYNGNIYTLCGGYKSL